MIKKFKYKNVLGKDFKTKTEAYKHFVSLRDQIALGTVLDETTAIKKSQMNQLFKDYFSFIIVFIGTIKIIFK